MQQELKAVSGKLAESIEVVGEHQRQVGVSGMEVQSPGKAARILNALANGDPTRKIERHFRVGGSLLTRMRRDHHEVLREARMIRAQAAAEVADQARELLAKKIDQLAGDEQALAKANLKDLGITFGIVTDKAQLLANDPTLIVQDQTPKVTLQDAMDFIEEAKAKVARQEENERIGIGFDGGGGGADQSSS
ncbi:MAG: hypothetical protein QF405_17550 [Roseibacillus sp.]|nr:hypothetical protein [Roseibacillus sp.]